MKKKLCNALCTLLICLLAGVALVVLVGGKTGRLTFIGGRAVVRVMTPSMEDTIPTGSYILLSRVKNAESEIKEGDVITFYSSDPAILGKLNTHRVAEIDRENGSFITKGDHNPNRDDAPVPYGDVMGRYVRTLPVLTAIGRFLSTGVGFFSTMFVFLILVCAVYLPDIIGAFSKKNADKEREDEIERRVKEEIERLKREDHENKNS